MNREKQCHLKNGTFGEEWKEGLATSKPIPADWVFKIKHRGAPIDEVNLQPNQYKARVVIRGQFMKEGLDLRTSSKACYSARIPGCGYKIWMQAEGWRCGNCFFGL